MGINFLVIALICVVFIFLALSYLFTRVFVRCPSNKVLAVQGLVSGGRTVSCFHGGAHLVWPLIQEARFIDLTPITLNIPLKGALSQQNIRVNVPSTFTIAVDTNPDSMTNAAVRLLDLRVPDIESMATEIILGQLRLTIASLTIEEINQDRERFLESIRKNIQPELQKIGLSLLNVNITDITDESGYIDSIGKKAAATAVNQAKMDVAEQTKRGDVGAAEADKERRVRVAAFGAEAIKGENEAKANVAQYNAILAEKSAEANRRGIVAQQLAEVESRLRPRKPRRSASKRAKSFHAPSRSERLLSMLKPRQNADALKPRAKPMRLWPCKAPKQPVSSVCWMRSQMVTANW